MIQRRLEGVATDIIEEHIPLLGAGLGNLLIEVALLIVNSVIKARLFGEPGTLLGATRNADHTAAFDLGNLPGNGARGTCRTRDQYGLAWLGIAQIKQTKVRCEPGNAQHREHHLGGRAFRHGA